MLTVIAAALFATFITMLILKSHRKDDRQLVAPRDMSVKLGVQIVCGDCAGNSAQPKRTFLTRFGVCEQCGGTSYVLASEWAMMRRIAEHRAEVVERSGLAARVFSFDRSTATNLSRREKIAV